MDYNKEIDKALKEYSEYEEAESYDDADRSLEKAKNLAIIALAKKFLGEETKAPNKAKAKEELKLTGVTDFEPVLVEVPKDEPVVEAKKKPAPKAKQTEEFTEQWTAQSMQALAEEMGRIEALIEEIGEEALIDLAAQATGGQVKEMPDITPLNIKLVLAYADKMREEADKLEI